MSSISVHDARPPTLSSPNLRKLDSSKFDKDRFLHSYIRSQEAHLSSYALEGKSVVASWNVEETDVPPKKIARNVELESGFGTPMLKPRVAIMRKANAETQDVKQARARHKVGKENEHRESSASREMAEENTAARGERDDNRGVGGSRAAKPARTKEEKSTSTRKEKFPAGSTPKEKVSRKPPAQGRGRDPDSEEEYRNRLTERRERRRAKKAIVDPKPDPPASNASSNDSDDGKKRKKSKGKKKGKGLSIPAGLALMHGFSATNIGKNRLTLEPAIGVFNKGKASARTKVKKAKEKKPQSKAKMFSENWFLGKTEATSRKAASTSSQSSGSNHHVEPEPESASPAPVRPPGKTKSSNGRILKHKRPRSPSTVDASPDEEAAPQDQVRLVKKRKTERAKSPVWDIELEDGQLLSDSHSDQHGPSESGTKVAGTLLLDTRAFSSRWAIPKDKDDALPTGQAIKMTECAAESQDDHQSDGASTIDPSHSASQVAYRGTTFSRFFPRPSGTQGESVAREDSGHNDAATVQPASRQRNPPDDPDNTVQSRMVHPAWDMPIDSLDTLHQDRAESLLSPARAPSGLPLVRDKSPLPATARPPSSTSSSNFRQEVVPGVSRADACNVSASHGTHPEYASSTSLNLPPSPLSPPISMGGIEATDFEGQDVTCAHDWTTEFLGLLGDDAPTDLFLSNVAGHAGSLERPTIDDDVLGAHTELAEEELPTFLSIDTEELEDEDTPGALCDPYLVEEEPHEVDCLQEYASQHYGSAASSWDGTVEEFYDIPHPRKRVKFSDDVLCYEDNRDIANTEPGEVWTCEPEPGINDAESDGLGEVGLFEFGDPDGRSAGTSDPDPAFVGASSQIELAVAVEDESSQPEEEEDGGQSEMEEERSVLESLQRFSQGRALLMGVASEIGVDGLGTRQLGVSVVEEDVARKLRGHWRRQKF